MTAAATAATISEITTTAAWQCLAGLCGISRIMRVGRHNTFMVGVDVSPKGVLVAEDLATIKAESLFLG